MEFGPIWVEQVFEDLSQPVQGTAAAGVSPSARAAERIRHRCCCGGLGHHDLSPRSARIPALPVVGKWKTILLER